MRVAMKPFQVVTKAGGFVKGFDDVAEAVKYMRERCGPGARCMKGKVVLAVRVALSGARATMKGALKRGDEEDLDGELVH